MSRWTDGPARTPFPRRSIVLAGRTLLMQAAHPDVDVGLRRFSRWELSPWDRLALSRASTVRRLTVPPAVAAAEGARLHALHTAFDWPDDVSGSRTGATTPGPWTWVFACTVDTSLYFGRTFLRWPHRRQYQVFDRWLEQAGYLGIPYAGFPSDLGDFHSYVDETTRSRLARTPSVDALMAYLDARRCPATPRTSPSRSGRHPSPPCGARHV